MGFDQSCTQLIAAITFLKRELHDRYETQMKGAA